MKKTVEFYTEDQYNQITKRVAENVKPAYIAREFSKKFNRSSLSIRQVVYRIKAGKGAKTFYEVEPVEPAKIEVVKELSEASINIASMDDFKLTFVPKRIELFNDKCIMYFK